MQPRFSLRVFAWVLGTAITFPPAQASAQDLCSGLVVDTRPHPMSPLAKPALGQAVRDPEFGTTIRRITAVVPLAGTDPVIKPMYSTISAWNADESLLILYHVGVGHELYDGRTYEFIRRLDITPADLEQVYWHTSNPDVLYYVSGNRLIRYRARSGVKETVKVFSFCTWASGGDDPMFTSWDSRRIGLGCESERFVYDIDADVIVGRKTMGAGVPQVSPSGSYTFLDGTVTDASLSPLRVLDLGGSREHASLGQLASGRDTFNAVAFDPGPRGSDVGTLVTHDMTDGSWRVIIGPATGYPYPPSGTHVSALAYRRPGWVFVSMVGYKFDGQDVLDNEVALADTNTGKVCRLAHHRSWGRNNTHLATPYWAEPHVVPSPSGTRALVGSDWGNGPSVDTYVIELPGYGGAPPPPPDPEPTPPPAPQPTPPPPPTPPGKNTHNAPRPKPAPPQNDPSGPEPAPPASGLGPNRAPAPQPGAASPSSSAATPQSPGTTSPPPVPLGDSGGRSASGEPGFGGGGEAGYSFAARPRARRATSGFGGASSTAAPAGAPSTTSGPATTSAPAGTPFSRGLAALRTGRYESAQKELQGAVTANPRDAAAHYYLGYTYHLIGQQRPAEREWARKAAEEIALAYRLKPDFTPVGRSEKAAPQR